MLGGECLDIRYVCTNAPLLNRPWHPIFIKLRLVGLDIELQLQPHYRKNMKIQEVVISIICSNMKLMVALARNRESWKQLVDDVVDQHIDKSEKKTERRRQTRRLRKHSYASNKMKFLKVSNEMWGNDCKEGA